MDITFAVDCENIKSTCFQGSPSKVHAEVGLTNDASAICTNAYAFLGAGLSLKLIHLLA